MINNQIEYKINKTLIIDKFTITDRAEALLASLLMTRSFSGKELISLMTISQDLKQCIRYLAEQEFCLQKEPFYENQLTQMKKKTKQLGLEKILNIKYLYSCSAEKKIKKTFEEINGVNDVVFSYSDDLLQNYPKTIDWV